MRKLIALAVAVGAALSGCSRGEGPNSLFDDAGYHVRDDTVYYLNPFPGKAFQVDGADPSNFQALDRTYARDNEHVFINGYLLQGADAGSFQLLDRPGFSKDAHRVYQHDHPISTDPDNFELIDSGLAIDSTTVYWSDGSVLSDDPGNFAIISDADNYLFAEDSHTVYVNANPIAGAAPTTFRVLQGAYARDDDDAFYFDAPIPGADVTTFRPLKGPYAVDAQRFTGWARPLTVPTLRPSWF